MKDHEPMSPQQFRHRLFRMGISQREAARRLKVAERTVRRWIAGAARIPESVDVIFGKDQAGKELRDVTRARAVLRDSGEGAKNVAAVLAAAAYEDTIRRMGREYASPTDRDDLYSVIKSLKTAGVLRGRDLELAAAYVKFRNEAIHARWARVDREAVRRVLDFVEELLIQYLH